jgi:hypothetical protein
MPPRKQQNPRTIGSASFEPGAFFSSWNAQSSVPQSDSEFRTSIINAFNLKASDDYVYRATAEVTLSQVQVAINHGNAGGLKAWYLYDDGVQVFPAVRPNSTACQAYKRRKLLHR